MHNVTALLDRLRCRRHSRDWWAYFGAFGDDFFEDDCVNDELSAA